MGRLIYRVFQCEVELDYIAVSRLVLVPVAKCLRQHKNWVQLTYPDCRRAFCCLVHMTAKHLTQPVRDQF